MTAITRILYPTDFSEPGAAALAPVTTLARVFHAEVILLHVIEPLPVPAEGYFPTGAWQTYMDETRREAVNQLDRLAGALKAEGVAVTTRLAAGPSVSRILDAAKEESADLIAMGTHGRTGLSSVLLGSVADKVVRLATCPVLTVRNPGMKTLKRILYPTDFSPAAAAAWPLAQRVAQTAGARLDILHVTPDVPEDLRIPQAVRDSMRAAIRTQAGEAAAPLIEKTNLPPDRLSLRLLTGVPGAEIVLEAKAHQVDLIVMGTHGFSGIVRWLLGSVAQHVIRTAPCPVVTVRPVERETAEERGAA